MKKLLLLILIGLLLALSVFVILQGMEFGELKILSFQNIQAENEVLDTKIQEAAKLAQKDYKEAVTLLENNIKELEKQKTEYEELILLGTDENGAPIGVLEEYDFENLLVKIGNYATGENTIMKMDVLRGNSIIENAYDLNFTISGSYIAIIDFISRIENDETLGFKIENFSLKPGSSVDVLQATFACNDIAINGITDEIISTNNANQNTEETNNENTEENTEDDTTKQ